MRPYTEPPHPPRFAYSIPRGCIQSVELSPYTNCRGKDLKSLTCYDLRIRIIPGCEQVNVQPD